MYLFRLGLRTSVLRSHVFSKGVAAQSELLLLGSWFIHRLCMKGWAVRCSLYIAASPI